MKHTELRAAVLDALEKHDTGATFFDGRPAVFDEADFPAVAVYLTGAEYTGEELDSDTWQAELHIEVFLPAQVPDSELDAWMESRIYPVMSDIPALSDLITSMVASGYDYRRDDDAGQLARAILSQAQGLILDVVCMSSGQERGKVTRKARANPALCLFLHESDPACLRFVFSFESSHLFSRRKEW